MLISLYLGTKPLPFIYNSSNRFSPFLYNQTKHSLFTLFINKFNLTQLPQNQFTYDKINNLEAYLKIHDIDNNKLDLNYAIIKINDDDNISYYYYFLTSSKVLQNNIIGYTMVLDSLMTYGKDIDIYKSVIVSRLTFNLNNEPELKRQVLLNNDELIPNFYKPNKFLLRNSHNWNKNLLLLNYSVSTDPDHNFYDSVYKYDNSYFEVKNNVYDVVSNNKYYYTIITPQVYLENFNDSNKYYFRIKGKDYYIDKTQEFYVYYYQARDLFYIYDRVRVADNSGISLWDDNVELKNNVLKSAINRSMVEVTNITNYQNREVGDFLVVSSSHPIKRFKVSFNFINSFQNPKATTEFLDWLVSSNLASLGSQRAKKVLVNQEFTYSAPFFFSHPILPAKSSIFKMTLESVFKNTLEIEIEKWVTNLGDIRFKLFGEPNPLEYSTYIQPLNSFITSKTLSFIFPFNVFSKLSFIKDSYSEWLNVNKNSIDVKQKYNLINGIIGSLTSLFGVGISSKLTQQPNSSYWGIKGIGNNTSTFTSSIAGIFEGREKIQAKIDDFKNQRAETDVTETGAYYEYEKIFKNNPFYSSYGLLAQIYFPLKNDYINLCKFFLRYGYFINTQKKLSSCLRRMGRDFLFIQLLDGERLRYNTNIPLDCENDIMNLFLRGVHLWNQQSNNFNNYYTRNYNFNWTHTATISNQVYRVDNFSFKEVDIYE